jgi:hypothetical protein
VYQLTRFFIQRVDTTGIESRNVYWFFGFSSANCALKRQCAFKTGLTAPKKRRVLYGFLKRQESPIRAYALMTGKNKKRQERPNRSCARTAGIALQILCIVPSLYVHLANQLSLCSALLLYLLKSLYYRIVQ